MEKSKWQEIAELHDKAAEMQGKIERLREKRKLLLKQIGSLYLEVEKK